MAGPAPAAPGAAMRRSLRTAAASAKETGQGKAGMYRGISAGTPAPRGGMRTALPSRHTSDLPALPHRGSWFPLLRAGLELVLEEWVLWTPSAEMLRGSCKAGRPDAARLSLCFPAASESRRLRRSQALVNCAPLKLTPI